MSAATRPRIWAGDVLRMLTRYAESRGFKTELLSASESDGGGYKEVVLGVKGDGAYSVFKYEGGTHRVQRVPETESQGRIHTSTATVAVMPEAEEVEVEINETTSRSTSTAPPVPAARASTRPTRPSGSRICRPGSSSRCRTRSRSSRKPDGVFLSNGPGDPAAAPYAAETVRDLVGKVPIFGVCMGHQILALAMGAKTYKLKFGHRGGNQPVLEQRPAESRSARTTMATPWTRTPCPRKSKSPT